MYELLIYNADKWKVIGEKLGCGDNYINNISITNETDSACLHILCDDLAKRITTERIVDGLQDLGLTSQAQKLSVLATKGETGSNICRTIVMHNIHIFLILLLMTLCVLYQINYANAELLSGFPYS